MFGELTKFQNWAASEILIVSFNVESREYNQKWYTDLRAWKIEKGSQNRDQEMVPPEEIYSDNGDSDLPF